MGSRETSFGYWLKRRREFLDLTQRELADVVGCSKVSIQKIESGERKPSKQIAELLAVHLKVPPGERQAFVRLARAEGTAAGSNDASFSDVPPWRLRRPTNLPSPLTAILGREDELERVVALLIGQGVRLLTLTGAPGIGKTRLAIQVATTLLDDFEDGAFLISLAALRDPERLPGEVARSLGLDIAADRRTLERLTEALRDRRMLLVLDNFEQVVSAAPVVSQLLEACRHVTALVTSREALRLRGENVLTVPPLAVPTSATAGEVARLVSYPAVALWAERARAVDHSFRVTQANARAVAEICIQLDGIPLAIELTAARLHDLGLDDVLAGMSRRLDTATGDLRDEPLRHRTLRHAIGWSYDLLSPSEQAAFQVLGVFAGGCTSEAVRAVLSPDPARTPSREIGADPDVVLPSLVGKGLLQLAHDGVEPRYTQLETLREFSLERLAGTGRETEVRLRHAAYFTAFAEAREAELKGRGQVEALHSVEKDLDNLRAALDWAIAADRSEIALRLGGALARFWYVRAMYDEGRQWLARVLALEGRDAAARAKIALGSGRLAEDQGDWEVAHELYARSLDLYRTAKAEAGVADALNNLGGLAAHQGDFVRAQALHEESLRIRRGLGDRRGVSSSLTNLGMVAANVGRLDLAQPYYEESLEIDRELGDRHGQAITLSNLGATAHDLGEHVRAREFHEQSLALRRELGDRGGIARSLNHLGTSACNLGDFPTGRSHFVESLSLRLEIGDRKGVADCLELIAWAEAAIGNPRRAAVLLGAAQALRDVLGIPLQPSERKDYEQALRLAEGGIAPGAFQAAWTSGREMGLEDVVASVLLPPAST